MVLGRRFVIHVVEPPGYLMLFYKVWNHYFPNSGRLGLTFVHSENLPAVRNSCYPTQAGNLLQPDVRQSADRH